MNLRKTLLILSAALAAGCGADEDNGRPDSGPGLQLQSCDLVISEILADPYAGSAGSEWLEIFNNSGKDIASLAGLTVEIWTTRTPGTGVSPNYSLRMTPGKAPAIDSKGYLVIYGGARPDGGAVAKGYYWSGLSLSNSGATLILKWGETQLHRISYGQTGVEAGKVVKAQSSQLGQGLLTGGAVSCAATKPEGAWCQGTAKYDGQNTGTPGKISDCAGEAPADGGGDGPGKCGLVAGDVLVSEVLSDPASASYLDEWLELYNNTAAPVDLACLKVVVNGQYSCSPTGTLPAHAFKVLHHGGGGAPAGFSCSALSLSNTGAQIEVFGGALRLSSVRYGASGDGGAQASFAAPRKGVAKQLSRALFGAARIDPQQAQAPGNWCDATASYDSANKGTPGASNAACGGGPPPDAGVDQSAGCNLAAGDLLVTEVQSDPADDYMNEWLEVYNNADRDLGDLSCVNVAVNTYTCPLSGSLKKGAFLVLHRGRTGSPSGGLTSTTLSISNTAATVEIKTKAGLSLHKILYSKPPDSGAPVTFSPPSKGVAKQLNGGLFAGGRINPAATVVSSAWCDATSPWGTGGNKGTPGGANVACK